MSAVAETHYRACHLCEAICGVVIETQNGKITSIKGDKDDHFSRGHICPKATALQDLHEDPDRLRKPVKKVGGNWQEISWEEAFETVAEKLTETQTQYGADAVGFFAGNPNVHNYGSLTHASVFRKALGTTSNYSATSLDQLPHMLVTYLMYGHQFLVPVPDIDHSNYMLLIGANPLASNGSMMTVPDVRNRLKDIQKRGGKFVVIDPRRTETAAIADEHHFIKPGSDAFLLMAMIYSLFAEGLVNTGHLSAVVTGVDEVREAVAAFTPEMAEAQTGISADAIRTLARDLAETDGAVCYGRMGVSTQVFGTLCQWAIQVLNILTGNMDVRGGALITTPAFGNITSGARGAGYFASAHSRVSGLPNFSGEFPATVLAEEMLTPGEGQIRSLITMAGNPVLSTPDGAQMEKALEGLDFMVSIDFYINATTSHADIIIPPTSALEHDNYDISFNRLAVRNTTRFNEALFEKPEGTLHDWEILNGLGVALANKKGLSVKPLPAPEHMIDAGIKDGPYGAEANAEMALTLDKIRQHPHGVDLGPLQPGLAERLTGDTPEIKLDMDMMFADMKRLYGVQTTPNEGELLLIGRRHVRSNNSWLHNSPRLVKGPARWHLLMHPDDMAAQQIETGSTVSIKSRVGQVETIVSASTDIMPGVVSLPHGWGHKGKGVKMAIASQQEGVNCNQLTDSKYYDSISGNAALNGVPVTVTAVPAT